MTYQSDFAGRLEMNAEWRREKAKEYPEDGARNMRAAELSDSLAAQFKAGDVDADMLAKYEALIEDDDVMNDVATCASETVGRIGFDYFPENPDDLLDTILRQFGE